MSPPGRGPRPALDAATWRRVEPILDEALERPADERAGYLDHACGADAALRAVVEALLDADEHAGEFLERPAVEMAPALFVAPGDESADPADAGRRFGPWRTVREVGRGGMGAVYEAVREGTDFHQRAALKLIPSGRDTSEILERFRRERRILASLEHPNIARLLDGGASDDGRPWIAMEFVEGERITDWCDTRALPVEDRLRLFLAACEAVRHAHRSLVVHRDLKPGNILVSTSGEVKLLDFGVARLLAGEGADPDATLTGTQASALTPRYAAPEQLRGDTATTVTDVYGLGLVLYELLTGHRAHEGDSGSLESIVRTVLERPIERPSAVVSHTRDGAPGADAIAARRGTNPERLRRRLEGDLDAILLTALAKEPRERYASVEAFAQDLQRHLAHAPVRARTASRGYRLRTFVRRHRVGFAVAAVAVAVLVGWAGTLAVSLERQRRAREAAEASAREAGRTRDFLASLIAKGGTPRYTSFGLMGGSVDPDARLRDVLDRASREVDGFFADEPKARLAMHVTLGETYKSLGVDDSAEAQLVIATRQAEALRDAKSLAIAQDLLSLLYGRRGRSADALHAVARSESAAVIGYGPRSREYAQALARHSGILVSEGQLDSVLAIASRSLAIASTARPIDSVSLVPSLAAYGRALAVLGRTAEAEAPLRAAVGWAERHLEPGHVDVLAGKSNLAGVLRENHALAEAEQLYRDVVAVRRRTTPGGLEIANTYNSLAMVLRERKQYAAAESAFAEAIAIRTRELGPENRLTLTSRTGLAMVYQRTGRAREAVRIHREVLEMRRRSLGPDHPLVANSLLNLGEANAALGRPAEAERCVREALGLRRRVLPAGHPDTRKAIEALAKLYEERGQLALAAATRADTAR